MVFCYNSLSRLRHHLILFFIFNFFSSCKYLLGISHVLVVEATKRQIALCVGDGGKGGEHIKGT